MQSKVESAAREYLARRARQRHPAGSFDKASRWYPADEEICPECKYIRTPSRSYPLSLNRHCRALSHVAAIYQVDVAAVRKVLSAIKVSESVQVD